MCQFCRIAGRAITGEKRGGQKANRRWLESVHRQCEYHDCTCQHKVTVNALDEGQPK